jgi:hypothetical protein
MKIPKLIAGKGYAGPEFYGCMNTGTRPCIFHLKLGGWSVGQEEACRGAMRFGLTYKDKTYYGEGRKRVWFYRNRPAAAAKFTELYGIRVAENEAVKAEHAATLAKARSGDIGAAIALGDY